MRVIESISASNNFSIWNGEVLSVHDFSKTRRVLTLFCYDIKMFANIHIFEISLYIDYTSENVCNFLY